MVARFAVAFISLYFIVGCSGAAKQRQLERDKISASSGLLCDFVNGDDYQDVDVELNIQMGRRCDPNRNFSISSYKNSADIHGVVFCCGMPKKEERRAELRETKRSEPAKTGDAKSAGAPAPTVASPSTPESATPAASAAPAAPATPAAGPDLD